MGKFGEIRSRKDVYERYIANGGFSISEPGEIGNVNSLSDFDSKKAGNFNSPAPPSPDNLRYRKNVEFLRSYFTDRPSHHFKNGLELANKGGNQDNVSNIENLDEDPVIFGFDFIINQISSPLYVELPTFFDFAKDIDEVKNRKVIYNDFIEHLELLFLSTRGGAFDSFKSHYLVGVDGLGDLINKSTGLGSNKQFTDFGKDKISLSMREDTHLSGGYLTSLYNTLSYSKINGKQIIPDNLLRFDATIIVSEIRNYKKIRKMLDSSETNEIISLTSDNVSRYMYNLYDCQFVLENHSHPSNVTNTKKDVADEFKLDFFYKFSTMEMEKFRYTGNDGGTAVRYTNDGNPVDPTRKYVGESSDNINAVRRNEFVNKGYQENISPYAKYDKVSNNNIQEDFSIISENPDELTTLRHNSMMESLKIQKENQIEKSKSVLEKMGENSLIMGEENSISGYIKDKGSQKFGEGGGLGGIINRTKDFAIDKVRKKRNKLINDTLQSIRNSTGLRRIGSPKNVYDDNLSVFGKLKNELSDFTNTGFTGLIGN